MPHRYRPYLLAAAAPVIAALSALPASGATLPERLPPSCEVVVTGMRPNGELITSKPVCWRGDRPESAETVAAASVTIAVHYTGASFGGSTYTVSGSGCNGGWLNLPSSWINVISSTSSSCAVTHFDNFYLSGSAETTFGSANLGPLNNRTNSARYS